MATVSAFESLAVTGTAGGFTVAAFSGATRAVATVEGSAVRFRLDGTAPTAAVGHMLRPGDLLELESNDEIQRAKFITVDGSAATLTTSFIKD